MKTGMPHFLRDFLFTKDRLPIGEQEKIEITKKGNARSLLVEGVKRILLYGDEEMVFSLTKERLVVRGNELDCVNYVSGAIGVVGSIYSIAFVEGETE